MDEIKEGKGWRADWFGVEIDLDRLAIVNYRDKVPSDLIDHKLQIQRPGAERLYKALKEALEATDSEEDLFGTVAER